MLFPYRNLVSSVMIMATSGRRFEYMLDKTYLSVPDGNRIYSPGLLRRASSVLQRVHVNEDRQPILETAIYILGEFPLRKF